MTESNLLKLGPAQFEASDVEVQLNLDISGHYSKPYVAKLTINREMQSVAIIVDLSPFSVEIVKYT